jgi:hypothetical protein
VRQHKTQLYLAAAYTKLACKTALHTRTLVAASSRKHGTPNGRRPWKPADSAAWIISKKRTTLNSSFHSLRVNWRPHVRSSAAWSLTWAGPNYPILCDKQKIGSARESATEKDPRRGGFTRRVSKLSGPSMISPICRVKPTDTYSLQLEISVNYFILI